MLYFLKISYPVVMIERVIHGQRRKFYKYLPFLKMFVMIEY